MSYKLQVSSYSSTSALQRILTVSHSYDLTVFKPGIYFVKLYLEENRFITKRLVVIR